MHLAQSPPKCRRLGREADAESQDQPERLRQNYPEPDLPGGGRERADHQAPRIVRIALEPDQQGERSKRISAEKHAETNQQREIDSQRVGDRPVGKRKSDCEHRHGGVHSKRMTKDGGELPVFRRLDR